MAAKSGGLSEVSRRTPRLLFIAPQPFYEDRGTPIAIREELTVLSEWGCNVDVVTYPMGLETDLPGIRLVRTANPLRLRSVPVGFSIGKALLDLNLLITTLQLARKTPYDCVHGVEEGAAIGLVCKALFGIPVIYDMHSSLPEQLRRIGGFKAGPGRWLALSMESWLVRHADCVVGSRGLASHVLSIAPGKPVWECSFNGYAPRFPSGDLPRHQGIAQRPTVVYSGNFAPYQGLEILIEAATLVREKRQDIEFVLVGGTELEIRHLSMLVERYNLSDAVQLHTRRPRHEVANYLALSHVLVLPRPAGENAPLKLYEYMNSGKPIVATDIPAHRSLLSEETAFLVPPGNPAALAEGILFAFRDKDRAQEVAFAAQQAAALLDTKVALREAITKAYGWAMSKGNRFLQHADGKSKRLIAG